MPAVKERAYANARDLPCGAGSQYADAAGLVAIDQLRF